MSRWRTLVVAGALLSPGGCTSNPTPHPHDDAQIATVQPDGAADPTSERGPDEDDNGVPDCEEAGGVWSNGGCRGADVGYDDVVGGDAAGGGGDADASDASDASDAADGDDAGGDGLDAAR